MRRHRSKSPLFLAFSVAWLLTISTTSANNKPTTDENGTISHTFCDGAAAELSCPSGKVISIVIGNYGRFSVAVCLPDNDIVPSNINCQNQKTKSILEKKCNGETSCDFMVDKTTFTEDSCPNTSKYLEVKYKCVVAVTTTTTTTERSTTTSDSTLIVEGEDGEGQKDALNSDIMKPKKKVDLFCPAVNRRGVNWQNTKAETVSRAPCPEGASGKQSWICSAEGHWQTEHPNSSECVSEWVSVRNSNLNSVLSNEDSTGLPEFLRELGSNTRRPMVGGDLPVVLHFLEKSVTAISEEGWAYKHLTLANKGVVEVMNYVLRNQEIWESWEPVKKKEFASRFMKSAEKTMAASAKEMKLIHDSNIIVQPAITVEVSHRLQLTSAPSDYLLIPSAAVWGGQSVDHVNLPRDPVFAIYGDAAQVIFSSFDKLGAQMTPSDVTYTPTGSNEPVTIKRKVVSRVVGTTIIVGDQEKKIEGMERPVRITFYHKESSIRHLKSPVCVWWDYENQDWSPSGCALTFHNESMTECECTHLTHFAVLMDIHGHELDDVNEMLLTTITYAGCTISIVCLLLTFFAYLIFSRNGGDRVFIHQNLSLSLALAEITFLAGISRTEDSVQCGVIAGALMYLFLSALMWMLLEGYHIHRMLTEVFPSEPRRFTYLLIGYMTPALITTAAYFYNSNGFGTAHHCWLTTQNHFIWFFAGPACLIFCANSLVLLKTLCTVYQHTSGGYLPCRHDVDSGRSIRNWVKGSMALASLLGVTWMFGLLWIDDSYSIVMAYAFTISNSLQGLFIFLFHVLFADKMRNDFAHWLYRRGCGGSVQSSPNHKRNNGQRDLMSPGMNSSSGSEFLYNTTDKYLTSSDTTNRLGYNPRMQHPNQISAYQHHPHHQIYEQQPGTYDYATIAYGDMLPGHMNRVAAPPAYQRLAVAEGRYGSQSQLYQGWHHRPPPEFSPPPPPSAAPTHPRNYGTGSSGRRPPSSKMSDDSAYSDGGSSSMLTTEVTPQGQTVLRIDLSKPNMYCQDL